MIDEIKKILEKNKIEFTSEKDEIHTKKPQLIIKVTANNIIITRYMNGNAIVTGRTITSKLNIKELIENYIPHF